MKKSKRFIFVVALFCLAACQMNCFALFNNLIKNPGFESFDEDTMLPAGWYCSSPSKEEQGGVSIDKDVKCKGEASLRIIQKQRNSYNYVLQSISVKKDTKYKLTVDAMVADIKMDGQGPQIVLTDSNTGNVFASKQISSKDWKEVELIFNTGSKERINIMCYLHKSSGTVWFDNLHLSEVK
jgi:hypothetical protein